MVAVMSVDGPANVGALLPGSSVSEAATPVSLGDSSGQAGSVSLSAAAASNSRFLTGKSFSFASTGGTFGGVVSDVSVLSGVADVRGVGVLQFLVVDAVLSPVSDLLLSEAVLQYMEACSVDLGGLTFSSSLAVDPVVVFPGWSGNVWARLKELCAVYACEIAVVGSVITLRDVGSLTATVTNRSPLRLVPSTVPGGRRVDVVYYSPVAVTDGLVWDSADTGLALSVGVGESRSVIIQTDHSLTAVTSPTQSLSSAAGTYMLYSSSGLTVTECSVEAVLGSAAGTIELTVTGPMSEPAGRPPPYRFATSAGVTSLSIVGSGVLTYPTTVSLFTPSVSATEVAATIRTPFMDSLERVYDRGVWAVQFAAGPDVRVAFEIPTADLDGFGLTAGALFEDDGSIYRVVDVSFGSLTSTVTAVKHVTIADVDAVWAGFTVGERDLFWSGFTASDRAIQPLRFDATFFLYPATTLYPATDLYPGLSS